MGFLVYEYECLIIKAVVLPVTYKYLASICDEDSLALASPLRKASLVEGVSVLHKDKIYHQFILFGNFDVGLLTKATI